MSTATVTMTPNQARGFRAAYGAEAARLSPMSKRALEIVERRLMVKQGIQRIYGGPYSKDEYISSVLNLLGYGTDRLNMATHVLAHEPGEPWSACPWCHPHAGVPCECALGRAS